MPAGQPDLDRRDHARSLLVLRKLLFGQSTRSQLLSILPPDPLDRRYFGLNSVRFLSTKMVKSVKLDKFAGTNKRLDNP